jgi:hypothetical protein
MQQYLQGHFLTFESHKGITIMALVNVTLSSVSALQGLAAELVRISQKLDEHQLGVDLSLIDFSQVQGNLEALGIADVEHLTQLLSFTKTLRDDIKPAATKVRGNF